MDSAHISHTSERIAYWDSVASGVYSDRGWARLYHQRLTEVYRFLVPPGVRVLELGCAEGDLLAALEPSMGVGVDFSGEMIGKASARHPELRFVAVDAHELEPGETFDVIIMSDLLNELWDVQAVFERIKPLTTPGTRIIMNFFSRLWQPPLRLVRRLGLAQPALEQNWLTLPDVTNFLTLTDYEPIRSWFEVLCPLDIPVIQQLCNRVLVKLWPFRVAALTNFLVAWRRPEPTELSPKPVVSVVVPARNEEANIPHIFERVPEMGGGTELIFVEGHSRDNTYRAMEEGLARNPGRRCKLFRQTGTGKGDAVRLGFEHAEGDIVMILDADLTVPPEDLPRFYDALVSGKAEYINGVRLVYPMEKQAMRFLNLLGNKFFTIAFSWLLGQPIKDTLCGTKVLWKKDYDAIVRNRTYFGDFDPFGDFDLIFGSAKLNLKMIDLPVRYRERTYGTTNIQRWRHGLLLLQMVILGARRMKFV